MKMANPQLENGFLRIATELWDAWCGIRIPGEAEQILKVIVKKTYGFNKKSDWISNSQFVELTGISKTHIARALDKLIAMKVVTKKGNINAPTYSLQKNYDKWIPLPKKVTVTNKGKRVTNMGKPVTFKGVYNKQSTIDTLQKTEEKTDKNLMFKKAWDEYDKSDYEHLELDTIFKMQKNWVANNPAKKNYKKFITNWLNKELKEYKPKQKTARELFLEDETI